MTFKLRIFSELGISFKLATIVMEIKAIASFLA